MPSVSNELLSNPNVRAFLLVIRLGEGTLGDDGYRTIYGGSHFDSFADHPRTVVKAGKWSSSAAGAYQFLSKTWDALVSQHNLRDFTPASQDLGALYLIEGRKALQDVLNGDISQAITKCNREWASLPGSPYGQPTQTMEAALAFYRAQGGMFRLSTGAPMGALALVLPSLVQAIPELFKIFGSGSEVSNRNIKAAELVVGNVMAATGSVNEQDLASKLDSKDPLVIAQAQAAVKEVWYDINVDSGGIQAARDNNKDSIFLKHPAIWVTLMLLPLVYITVMTVLQVRTPWGTISDAVFTSEIQSMVVASIISGVLGGIMGFWLGTSFGSQRKTEIQGK